MQELLLFIQVIIAIVLIGLIMIQPSQGAHAGSAFGAGGSQSVFGSQGSTSFLAKLTTYLAIAFFINSLILARFNSRTGDEVILNVPTSSIESKDEVVKDVQTIEVPSHSEVPATQ